MDGQIVIPSGFAKQANLCNNITDKSVMGELQNMRKIKIDHRYLCFPAAFSGMEARLQIFADQQPVKSLTLWVSPEYTGEKDRPGFMGWIDVSAYIGRELVLEGDMQDEWLDLMYQDDTKPRVKDRGERPQIHYTASQGWLNDPNGLIVYNDVYHLFYQYNPFSKSWGNMHWGHATSKNLIDWQEHDPAIAPNRFGVAFSGCAVTDAENVSGLGCDAIILYYTAYLEGSPSFPESVSTIRRYYSTDHGRSFKFDENFCLAQIVPGNRDPKIFYHEESKAWIMVMFLELNEFAILRSDNLNEWAIAQRFSLEDTWECPDLFSLEDPETHKRHWIFWTGDGYYYIGDFDGYYFSNISGRKQSSATPLAYAAQTFFNTANRIISLSWLRTSNYYSPYTGMMSLPKELGLRQTESGLVLEQRFVREICSQLISSASQTMVDRFDYVHLGGAFQLKFQIDRGFGPSDPDTAEIDILEKKLLLDFRNHTCTIGNTVFKLPKKMVMDFDIFIDYGVIEILVDEGTRYAATEYYFSSLTGNIRLAASSGNMFRYIEINDFIK
jgi:sucrose-6-phosphate hydrolase SacC (GH32 family)